MTPPESSVLPLPVRHAPDWVDPAIGVLAAVLAVAVLVSTDTAAIDPRLEPATVVVASITAVGAAGTALRRRRPLLGMVVVGAAATVVSATGHFTGLLPYLMMFALYGVAAHGTRRAAAGGLGLAAVTFVALQLAGVPDLTVADVATSLAICVAVTAVGDAVRQRRAHQADLMSAAEGRALAASERAVAEERLRIARELHDVVAHSMSLIAVQAGVGAHVLRRDPDAAEQALAVIAETSRTALTQTRSVVGLLRNSGDTQPVVPGLVSLGALVQGVRDAGLTVDLRVTGQRRDVPTTVDLAAYRVVQEALTNAVKHAPHAPVDVLITYTPTDLLVNVSAPGAVGSLTPRPSEPGFGLVGLRERARAVGGRLAAGPTPDGGFQVSAELPTSPPAS